MLLRGEPMGLLYLGLKELSSAQSRMQKGREKEVEVKDGYLRMLLILLHLVFFEYMLYITIIHCSRLDF